MRVCNVSFFYTVIHVPDAHCKTKYTSSSHQVPANQNTYNYDCFHNIMKIHMLTLLLTQYKGRLYIMGCNYCLHVSMCDVCVCIYVCMPLHVVKMYCRSGTFNGHSS